MEKETYYYDFMPLLVGKSDVIFLVALLTPRLLESNYIAPTMGSSINNLIDPFPKGISLKWMIQERLLYTELCKASIYTKGFH